MVDAIFFAAFFIFQIISIACFVVAGIAINSADIEGILGFFFLGVVIQFFAAACLVKAFAVYVPVIEQVVK